MQLLTQSSILMALATFAAFASIARAQTPNPPSPPEEKTYTIAFNETPWPEVFKWFEKETGLTYIQTEVKPTGTLTARSGRKYNLPQVIDLFNEALAPQKMCIFRRSQTFFVHGVDERLPEKPVMITPVCAVVACPPQCVVRAEPCRLRQIFRGRCR